MGRSLAREYAGAASRHLSDGTFLDDGRRSVSADHLFGLGAECAIKSILVGVAGVKVAYDAPAQPFRTHIDALWPLAAGVIGGMTAAHYAGPLLAGERPFDDWKVDGRYDHSNPPTTAAVARFTVEPSRRLSIRFSSPRLTVCFESAVR